MDANETARDLPRLSFGEILQEQFAVFLCELRGLSGWQWHNGPPYQTQAGNSPTLFPAPSRTQKKFLQIRTISR